MIKQLLASLGLVFMALLTVGCGAEPKPLNVTIELDDVMRQNLNSRKIQVDFVAVNDKQNERWENYSMTRYWKPNDSLRTSVPRYEMIFDPNNSAAQTLSAKDPIWEKWFASNANRLYVLVFLPGMIEDQPGDKDPRRQILPLEGRRWKSSDVRLIIQQTGVITITPPLPAK